MNQRKRLIQETISVILSEVLDTAERRKDTLAKVNKELTKADKRTLELARQGYPDEHAYTKENDARYYRMKTLRDKIMARQGMNEDVRHPDLVLQEMDNHIEKRGWIPPHLHKELKDSMIAYGEMEPDKPRRKKRPQKGTENPTNEETLHELYTFAGLYGRAIGSKRNLSPEEQAKGANPYLTPEGKTTYPTGPLANILGRQLYGKRALESVGEMDKRFTGLKQSTENLLHSIASGKIRADTAEDVLKITNPRMAQIDRIVRKMAKRTASAGKVIRDARSDLGSLPPLPGSKPNPEEPPHYYG